MTNRIISAWAKSCQIERNRMAEKRGLPREIEDGVLELDLEYQYRRLEAAGRQTNEGETHENTEGTTKESLI